MSTMSLKYQSKVLSLLNIKEHCDFKTSIICYWLKKKKFK